MADGIYYNQEVTAEMLNGIAHDLGHTSFSGFGTDKFGADALNGITKDLVTAGVLLTGNQCKVVRSEDGKIILQDGIIVFANGAKKVISEPLTIEADNGTVIYAYNNVAAGTCTIEVAESFPGDGDYVKLASVGADGVLTEERAFAIVKALKEATFRNDTHEFTITHERWSINMNNVVAGSQTIYKMPHTGFNYMLLLDADLNEITYYRPGCIVDLNKEGVQSLSLNESGIYANLYAERKGDEIIITSIYKGGGTRQHTFYLKLV